MVILVPNLLWMVFPPREQPDGEPDQQPMLRRVLEILEWVGRIAAFVLPLAISPIVYFFAASVLFRSWYPALSTLILAIGHLPISFCDSAADT
jgi:hypothetical protein